LLKNSSFDFVLKGCGFKPRRKYHKIDPALAAEAPPQTAMPLFQQTVKPLGFDPSATERRHTAFESRKRKLKLKKGVPESTPFFASAFHVHQADGPAVSGPPSQSRII
jgi:hypothetical protein